MVQPKQANEFAHIIESAPPLPPSPHSIEIIGLLHCDETEMHLDIAYAIYRSSL